MNYKLIVDYGKPFEIICNTKEVLFNELLRLEQENQKEDYAYFDVIILNSKGIDITKKIFQEYNFKKEKAGFLI